LAAPVIRKPNNTSAKPVQVKERVTDARANQGSPPASQTTPHGTPRQPSPAPTAQPGHTPAQGFPSPQPLEPTKPSPRQPQSRRGEPPVPTLTPTPSATTAPAT